MFPKIITSVCFVVAAYIATAQLPKEKSLLWKIEGNKLQKPSYLFGTMHILCKDDIIISETLKQSFDNTKELFLEIDMDDPQMMAKSMQGMMMKNNESITDFLSKADYDSMAIVFKEKSGFPLQAMAKAKPILLMAPIIPSLIQCKVEGLETRFIAMAKEQKKDVKGLESIEYQMRVMDTIPYKKQADMLKQILFNLDSTKNSFIQLANLYKSKDINGMYALSTESADFGSFEATMLINRNKNWIPVIEEQVKQQATFFAVGAAHLGGEYGVIALLRKQGYTVTAIKE
jgi:uncharacterized protein